MRNRSPISASYSAKAISKALLTARLHEIRKNSTVLQRREYVETRALCPSITRDPPPGGAVAACDLGAGIFPRRDVIASKAITSTVAPDRIAYYGTPRSFIERPLIVPAILRSPSSGK